MKMTRNERNVLARLLGEAVVYDFIRYWRDDIKFVTVEKLRYVDLNTFCFVARAVYQDGTVEKRVMLSTDVWSPALSYFAKKRGIQILS